MSSKYPRLAVDPVFFVFKDQRLKVLLVRRQSEPEKGRWALPGGQSFIDQLTVDTVQKHLVEKTGVNKSAISHIEQLHTFDTLGLDKVRGHAVTITYLLLSRGINESNLKPNASLFDIDALPELAFDHISIIEKGRSRLKDLLEKTNIASKLLPEELTLNEIYWLHSSVYSIQLDNRNFRKKYLSFKVLEDTGSLQQGVAHRPSKLYRYKSDQIENLSELLR